jgi:hypothetical protein
MSEEALKLRLPFIWRLVDQATRASGSTHVSPAWAQSTTMGVPREVTATHPVPVMPRLNRPCPANLATPLTR